jgi:hypothetical protein
MTMKIDNVPGKWDCIPHSFIINHAEGKSFSKFVQKPLDFMVGHVRKATFLCISTLLLERFFDEQSNKVMKQRLL